MQDRGRDEWAVLVDFDTKLFRKEQEMKELKLREQKRRYLSILEGENIY
jgi:hypothetical protein